MPTDFHKPAFYIHNSTYCQVKHGDALAVPGERGAYQAALKCCRLLARPKHVMPAKQSEGQQSPIYSSGVAHAV